MDNARNLILTAWLVFAMTGCDSATQSPHVDGSQLEALTIPQDFEGVSALAVDPGGVIYAGDRRGRLSVSVDGGKTWSALIDSSTGPGGGSICEGWNCETRDLVADRMDPSRLFLRKVDSDWKRGGSFFRSDDEGRTWSRVGPDWVFNGALAIAPSEPRLVYFGTDEGLFKSLDNGETSRRVLTAAISDVAISRDDASVIYAVGDFVHRSEDGGLTWEDRSAGLFSRADSNKALVEGHPRISKISVDPENANELYLVAHTEIHPETLFQSRDGGLSWKPIGFTGHQINTLEIDPNHSQIVYVGCGSKIHPNGTYVSRDAGQTFLKIHDIGSSLSLAFDPTNDNVVYEGTNKGLYKHIMAAML